ncbi:MAG TPA: class I SAM-dependent methyltransferase [Bryobacteraceae bacterium]|nr:class I SAM-dependent methyltransferase [Bryobacteraceae bacterium]
MQTLERIQTASMPRRGELAVATFLERLLAGNPAVACQFQFPSGYRAAVGARPPEFTIDIRTQRGLRAIQSLNELQICEAYMNDDIDIGGDMQRVIALRDLLEDQSVWITAWRKLQPLLAGKSKSQEAWVHNHYDSENLQLYFLDAAYNTYTPGVFEREDESLEMASERKHRLAFEGLQLKPGDRVLDIGCGWGSFLRFATRRGVNVTGITLSRHQLGWVQRELIDKEQLPATLHYGNFFEFEAEGTFDAISMLGVIEELADYERTLERVARLVKPGGRVYLDFMAATKDFVFPAFISKYIYQGGTSRVYLPKFTEAATRSPFEIVSIHNDRRNYYLTSQHWFNNLERNRNAVRERFGEKTFRMFRLYLAGLPEMLDARSHLTTAYRVMLELPKDAIHA